MSAVDEARRLLALRDSGILDTQPDPVFDGLAALAKEVFGVAGAAVVFVDERRTWAKAAAGEGGPREAPREACLCRLVPERGEMVVLEDVLEDPHGRGSAAAGRGLRFFAGAPVRAPDGDVLGAFALVDPAPASLDAAGRARLAAFAGLAGAAVEEHRIVRAASSSAALLKEVARQMPRATSRDFIEALGRCLTRALDVDFAFVSELVPETDDRMKTCTLWERDRLLSAATYLLEGTPCGEVLRTDVRSFPGGVRERFPDDRFLVELGVESYAAVPLMDARDRPLGLLGIMHRRPLDKPERLVEQLEPLAPRVAAEVERLRTERALERAQARNRALLGALPDAVFRIDRSGRYLDCHAGKRARLPVPPAEFIGRNVRDIMTPGDAEECLVSFARALETREIQVQEHTVPGPEGERDYEARIVASGPDEVICFVRDVTARKRAEERRRVLERRLLESQKRESLGDLAGGVAHELNNMLVAILGNAGLVRREVAPDSSLAARLGDLEEAAQRAAALAKQMLAFSGRGHFEMGPLDLAALLEEARRLLEVALPRRVTLRVEAEAGLESVHADASQMRQAVLNLVANAGEAMGEGPGEITVRVATVDADRDLLHQALGGEAPGPGRFACIEVADTGPGMDDAARARCVEPFFSTRGAGRGLGLPAVVGIARGHGGALLLDTAPGDGCRFRLLLPLRAPAGAGGTRGAPGRAGTRAVLVVDDEPAVREVLRHMLRELGREVVDVSSGARALEVLEERGGSFDTVFLDLMMPGMTGDAVCRDVRRLRPDMRVILMSGYDQETVADTLAGPGVEFLPKPFKLEHVREVLGRL